MDVDIMYKRQEMRIINSVCQWNAQRYPQEYDYKLAASLLKEEVKELLDAKRDKDLVNIVDAYADIIYVGIGILWKMSFKPFEIYSYFRTSYYAMTLPKHTSVNLLFKTTIKDLTYRSLLVFLHFTFIEFVGYTREPQIALDLIEAICKSNETKVVVKTKPGIKANINKGSTYVAPTEKLNNILAKFNLTLEAQ